MAAALDIPERTVFRSKRRYAGEGLDEALHRRNQVSRYRKLDGRAEAHLIALACSPAPEGQDHWTLRALAGKTVELGLAESLSHETVRLRLKKIRSSRGARNSGAFPRWAPGSWPTGRTRWICTPNPTARKGRRSALTRPRRSCWQTSANRCPPSPEG